MFVPEVVGVGLPAAEAVQPTVVVKLQVHVFAASPQSSKFGEAIDKYAQCARR